MRCVGIDGESIAPWGYSLLSSSDGRKITKEGRLSSRECFDFLLSNSGEGARLFAYGLGYDVSHWVADLSSKERDLLATKGICYTQQGVTCYRLIYRPGAYFSVYRLKGLPVSYDGRKVVSVATVVDLMRWHRKPFVDVCEEWGAFSHCVDADFLRRMKGERQTFDAKHPVESYCEIECEALSSLGEQMTSRLSDLGIPISHPFTAGAVAGALMARNRVHDHWQEPPAEVSDAVSRAFFGGREQCSRYGYFRDVTQWDIRSAYGWAMTQLPDMQGIWLNDCEIFLRDEECPKIKWSLYKVQWDIDEGRHPVMPFPWRAEDGRVHYPPRGTGWQWSPIVGAAFRNYPGSDIRIYDAWHYIPFGSEKPFSYIRDLFSERARSGSDPVSGLLKSIIVATWGRMCSPGGRPSKTRGQLAWAGMTTALIQERMLDAIHATGENEFISACVDGFWSSSKLDLLGGSAEENRLGYWACSKADELLLLRPTCYWKRTGGEWSAHTAGIPGGQSIQAEALRVWSEEGWRRGRIDIQSRRCKGLLACQSEGDYSRLGEFVDLPLSLSFNPGMGKTGHECPTMIHGPTWRKWNNYWPPVASSTAESAKFVSRTGLIDDRWKERQEANAIEETSE